MQRKKSRFWLFIFSFIPGAGEMYMGFMRMGLSLMLGFMILVAIVGYTNLGVLSVFPIALYIYSFFHANNLGSLDDITFHNIEDQYLFGFDGIENMKVKLEGRNRKIAAVILIILGVIMLWQVVFNLLCDIFGWDNVFLSAIYYFVRDELPKTIVGIAVIWAGLALIRGKRIEIEEKEHDDRQSAYRERDSHGDMYGAGSRLFYGEPFVGNGQPDSGQYSAAGGGQAFYGERPAADRYQDRAERPVADGQQGRHDGNIIYAGGPVADYTGQDQNQDQDRDADMDRNGQ